MMSKSEAIWAIRNVNPSVSEDFLADFSERELKAYLLRLSDASSARNTLSADTMFCDDSAIIGKASPA